MDTDDIPPAVGDVVRLKSGGPDMTAVHVEPATDVGDLPVVRCVWFWGGTLYRETFRPRSLVSRTAQPMGMV